MFDVSILTIIPELTQGEFGPLLPLVSPKKQERIRKFHFFRHAQNCLLGDVLSRTEICRTTGLGNKQLEFYTNEYGKPFLINKPHIHFNISHAEHYIACVISDDPVGIDIEFIKPADLKIAERFFTLDETAYIMAGEWTHRFYEVWTKKESQIKWEGKGLHIPLSSFSVFKPNAQIKYHTAFQNNEAMCHVCSKKQIMPVVKVLDTATFLRHLIL